MDRRLHGITLRRGCHELHDLFFADDSLFFFQGTVENVRSLKTIIMDYCRASGQRKNTEKCTLIFNWGANGSLGSAIERELNIENLNDPGKYLGLPSMWGRPKKASLGYLK